MTQQSPREVALIWSGLMDKLQGDDADLFRVPTAHLRTLCDAVLAGQGASDQVIELAVALEVRRILEAIKEVANIYSSNIKPTPVQSAWQTCCEEIFYRATGEQWHMDEDAEKFSRRSALECAALPRIENGWRIWPDGRKEPIR